MLLGFLNINIIYNKDDRQKVKKLEFTGSFKNSATDSFYKTNIINYIGKSNVNICAHNNKNFFTDY